MFTWVSAHRLSIGDPQRHRLLLATGQARDHARGNERVTEPSHLSTGRVFASGYRR
jgi:hypothetical protein